MRTVTLSPLFRHTVGFDRFNDMFDNLVAGKQMETGNVYPPHNIEKLGEDQYRITMAVAGFTRDELEITTENDKLVVIGKAIDQEQEEDREYLYKGIATRAFERKFSLADHVKVVSASLENGLLQIDLLREVPEASKPRSIPIAHHKEVGSSLADHSKKTAKKLS